ncbi:hypothetical protein [Pseudomonas citronellolis]|uniref:hypothetical protein n=1 Tax=Pseudomonas citronellolis TaxID=53408 RepID=UPI001C6DFE1B|nr:hypothetical protein [Pseudomonas citronellolis]MCP1607017.1 hypothetical protein [Pseudomonas citronellolis]MCP1640914.1 hypothetical protein [Pseudomonas citronellolis]MCP1657888.1 hypothetical protein [Pseudomonas citronellolis]MCP1663832.1 hypothetical protein [Pseudomonas citronellolis]MCP1697010.1 hypothetical protein [Pseudomonas citronellolis]
MAWIGALLFVNSICRDRAACGMAASEKAVPCASAGGDIGIGLMAAATGSMHFLRAF